MTTHPESATHAGDVHGSAVLTIGRAIEDACGFFAERTSEYLAEYGLDEASAQAWYDVAEYAAVYEDLLETTGEHTVHRIGKELAFTAQWNGVDSVTEALNSLDDVYGQRHRGNLGGYEFEQTGDESGRLVCKTPYPAAAERGFLRGIGQQFTDTGFVTADIVEQHREDGLRVTTVDVEWWESTDIETGSSRSLSGDATRGYAGAD